MEATPQSKRPHVAILGETNSGKSALFNAILGSETAIVSPVSGTTTDPIFKSMELIPFGPIVLIDTAGLNDDSALGGLRQEKTSALYDRIDYAIYAIDTVSFHEEEYEKAKMALDKRKVPHLVVFTKYDIADLTALATLSKKYENTIIVSVSDHRSVDVLKLKLSDALSMTGQTKDSLIDGILSPGDVAVIVAPPHSAAPKGRLIPPQAQFIRDCLDCGVRCNVTTPKYLARALTESQNVELVVTDSQVFKEVAALVPADMPLTSFSILMARQKSGLAPLLAGIRIISDLKDGDNILIAEMCLHNRTHEDIGRVKLPDVLKRLAGKALSFTFSAGHDFPDELEDFALVVHCGGCMAPPKEVTGRVEKCVRAGVPVTNYGMLFAHAEGILARSAAIFETGGLR